MTVCTKDQFFAYAVVVYRRSNAEGAAWGRLENPKEGERIAFRNCNSHGVECKILVSGCDGK